MLQFCTEYMTYFILANWVRTVWLICPYGISLCVFFNSKQTSKQKIKHILSNMSPLNWTETSVSLPASCSGNLPFTGEQADYSHKSNHHHGTHLPLQLRVSFIVGVNNPCHQNIPLFSPPPGTLTKGRKKAWEGKPGCKSSTTQQPSRWLWQIYITVIKAQAGSSFNHNGCLSSTFEDPEQHKACLFVHVFMAHDWL